ncbi:MAG TPA: hypothetical protein V6D14_31550 [Coleofasciculaceae cyanobacterium]|jgi:hypothetical protein
MISSLTGTLKTVFNNSYLKLLVVITLIALIGFSTVNYYGLSVDEPTEIAMVRRNFELIKKGTPIPGDLKYFGPVFNVASEIVFQAQQYLVKGPSYNPLSYGGDLDDRQTRLKALADRVKVKHYLTFLVSLITYGAVAGIVGILCGGEYAWFGALTLAFFPTFWGHSFFNPKDPPFAALFTLTTLLGSYLVTYYLKTDEPIRIGKNRVTLYTILYGVLVGVLSGIRIGGFLVLFFIFMTYLILKLYQGGNRRDILDFGGLYLLLCVTWFATNTFCYPAFWSNPIGGFFETLDYLSGHRIQIKVLFEGTLIPIQHLPWNYLPTWMFMTIPLIFQVGLVVGTILILSRYSKLSILQRACAILVFFQVFFLPLVAIVKHSPMYDGMRHFLFTLPGMAAISATAFIWIYQKLSKNSFKIIAVTFLTVVFVAIAFDMVAFHPYQYAYFNRVSGGLKHAKGVYDTEYWGLSLREGMEWINKNAQPGTSVLVGGFTYSAELFAAPSFKVIDYTESSAAKTPKPYYYLAWPRWNAESKLPGCPVVYRVIRQEVPLSVVKRCD